MAWCSSPVAVSVRADTSQALGEEVGVSKTRFLSEYSLGMQTWMCHPKWLFSVVVPIRWDFEEARVFSFLRSQLLLAQVQGEQIT